MRRALIRRASCPRHGVFASKLLWSVLAILLARPAWPDPDSSADATPAPAQAPAPATPPSTAPAAALGSDLKRWLTPATWFNPATAPFIPVPLISVDPDSGTTLGLLPVRLQTDENNDIRRIFAPDVLYNPYFGYGAHARVYAYPSEDEQWSVVLGGNERVQRQFDAEFQSGRLREHRWSFTGSLVFNRDGTPRFFGIGNDSPAIAETDYTEQQEWAQGQIGLNLSHTWQVLYTVRVRNVDVLPGTLAGIDSLETRFGRILGVGRGDEFLNRGSIVYDTRDDVTIPTKGMEWVAYGGMASRRGVFNDSLYSEAGIDGRDFWPIAPATIIATHMSLRYMPDAHRLPFWALSSLGGDESQIGGDQPLRGFGPGRYYDRDAFSTSIELRRTVWSLNTFSTHVDVELAPFADLGRVWSQAGTWPLAHLHSVGGLGFRGIARPFVVGYVDVGYGSEGVAVFTGINYVF
jgi:hypothetical protein